MTTATRLALLLFAGFAATARADLPDQWSSGGFKHEGFQVGLDHETPFEGKPSLHIQSTEAIQPHGEANAGTGFSAQRYLGKRLRYSASMKSEGVQAWSGLWMRVSGPAPDGGFEQRLRFDNMRARPVKGTTAWTRYDIVLDVPKTATNVAIGFFLVGRGAVWMGAPSVTEVGLDVPVTSSSGQNLPPEPQLNLTKQ